MAFFYGSAKAADKKRPARHVPVETMRQMGCRACPLDKADLSKSKTDPTGPRAADVYVLGSAPFDINSDAKKLLDRAVPRGMKVRSHNTVRCLAKNPSLPGMQETECCRGFIVKDIEACRPRVVVGLGAVPLAWATGMSGIGNWRGKFMPVRIGDHVCWYYPTMDPSFVVSKMGTYGKSEHALLFEEDWRGVGRLLEGGRAAKLYAPPYDAGVTCVTGQQGRSDLNRMEDLLNGLVGLSQVAIDIETNSMLRPYRAGAKIITCSVGTFESTVAFALDHPDGWSGPTRSEAWGLFAEFLLQSGRKVAHSLGFELEWLCFFFGKELAYLTEWGDTMAMAHTLDERKGGLSLDDQIRQRFGFFLKEQSQIDVRNIMDYPLPDVLRYNGMDSKWTDLLAREIGPEVYASKSYAYEYERKVRLEPALVMAQLKGVDVDFDYAERMRASLESEAARIEKALRVTPEVQKFTQRFGQFSPTSPDHVVVLMRDVCGRDEVRRDGGGVTSEAEALEKIPPCAVPSAPLILEHRAVMKNLGTYVLPVCERRIVMPDGKIHTKYNSMIAETSRLSSDDPNMQNFPKRKHREIRGMVVASRDRTAWFAPFDYGQLEARAIAWASEDESLMRALWTGYDIHGFWTDRFIDEYPAIKDRISVDYKLDRGDDKKLRKTLREEMKNGWVFPQFFGSHFRSCARNLKIPEEVAERMANEFWGEFRGVKKWQNRLISHYEKHMYVELLDGTRRRGALSKNQIINTPVQGTAAHFVEDAMVEVSELSVVRGDDELQPALNIHDDLTFCIADRHEGDMMDKVDEIARVMCRHRYSFINVPVVVEVTAGKNWYKQEPLHVYRSDKLFNLRNPYA